MCLSNTKVNENTTAVGTVSATDEGPLKYTLFPGVGGEDNAKFVLNLTTGVLTFAEPPDFENPLDLGDTPGDNTYSILVHATDELGVYAEKVFIITVLDVDDVAPVITIHPGIKLSMGPISDTTFTVSDRYSIKEVKVDLLARPPPTGFLAKQQKERRRNRKTFPLSTIAQTPITTLSLTAQSYY